jgi:predicted ArsR family transcriptional regulator
VGQITESELLQQVRDALDFTETEDGAMSVLELAESLDISPHAVRTRLRKLIASGSVELVRVRRTSLHGVVQRRVAYQAVKKSEDES